MKIVQSMHSYTDKIRHRILGMLKIQWQFQKLLDIFMKEKVHPGLLNTKISPLLHEILEPYI